MKDKNNIIKFAICSALLLIVYIPTLKWMWDRWMAHESYYSHGILIPIVSLFILWQKRSVFSKNLISSSASGLAIIFTGVIIHLVCATLRVYFISGFSFVFVLYGLVLYFFGKKIAKELLFPIFFLLTMVPLPLVLIGNLIVKMKLFAAQIATLILNNIGFPSIRSGSIIKMPNSFIAVEAPCSGLRSLISLLTLGLLFSYFAKVSYVKKFIILAASIPIALISNIIRILLIAIVNDLYGEKIAMGFFHDFTGFLVFVFAFLGLVLVLKLVEGKDEI